MQPVLQMDGTVRGVETMLTKRNNYNVLWIGKDRPGTEMKQLLDQFTAFGVHHSLVAGMSFLIGAFSLTQIFP